MYNSEQKPPSPTPNEPTDYPRPAPPGEQQAHDPQHVHDDHEEVPKKDRKKGHGGAEHERRLQENIMKRAELNRPTKEMGGNAAGKGSMRIAQPAGKGFAA